MTESSLFSVIPPSAPLPESWRGCANPGRICRVVGSARVGRDHVDSSRCVQGVGAPRIQRFSTTTEPCSRIRQSRRRRVQLVGQFHAQLVVPNASWIAVVVAFSELAIGIGLAFGFLTRIARSPAWRCSSRTSCRVRPVSAASTHCARSSCSPRGARRRGLASTNHRWIQAASSPRRTGRSSGRCDTSSGTRFGRLVKSESLSPRRSHMERRGLFA